MLKVIFFLKSSIDKNGESSIFARLYLNKQRISISTGKTILKKRWAFTNNLRNVLKIEKEKVIKSGLDLFQLNAEKKFNELFKIDPGVTLELLKAELGGKVVAAPIARQITILEVLDKYNKSFKKKVIAGERATASLQKYERCKELLLIFLKKHYEVDDMEVQNITHAFVFNLEEFLKYESNFKGKIGIKNNSVVKYMKMYKAACNYSVKMDLLVKNPFSIYDGKLSIKDATFLTQHELNTIENKVFSITRLEKIKDIFIFCYYTGYAPVDALELTERNLSEDSNGNLWIITSRAKTAIRANVPVLLTVENIIAKYKNQQKGLIPKFPIRK